MKRAFRIFLLVVPLQACGGSQSKFDLSTPVTVSGQPIIVAQKVCQKLGIPCGIEDYGDFCSANASEDTLQYQDTPAVEVLKGISKAKPFCSWSIRRGVLLFRPRLPFPGDPLNRRIDSLAIHDKRAGEAVIDALRAGGIQPTVVYDGVIASGTTKKRISLDLHAISIRDALTTVANADGGVTWSFSFTLSIAGPKNPTLSLNEYPARAALDASGP